MCVASSARGALTLAFFTWKYIQEARMTGQQLLAQQFKLFYDTAARNVSGMTHEQSLAQTQGGGNCANWILGHLVNVHNSVMRLVNEAPVWEDEQLKRAGFDPITGPQNAIDWDTLRDRFLGSRERCLAAVNALSDEALNEGDVPHPFGGTTTRGELLNTLAFHQAYHAGQLGLTRRAAGLAGAIRGPGQPPRPAI
jgi:uncharacterized damage-inducible protein DinB